MELQLYENLELKLSIETFTDGANVWFKGIDVAKVLEYKNTQKAIRDHVDDEYKIEWVNINSGKTPLSVKRNESTPPVKGTETMLSVKRNDSFALHPNTIFIKEPGL